jgi:hypothetical protein
LQRFLDQISQAGIIKTEYPSILDLSIGGA